MSTYIEGLSPRKIDYEQSKSVLSHALIKRRIDLPTQSLLSVEVTVIVTRGQAFLYNLGVDVTHLTREFDLCYRGQLLTEK